MKKPKLVIFDMDGTMLDTERLSIEGWKQAVPAQIPHVDWDIFYTAFHEMIGSNYDSCKRVALKYFPTFDFEKGNEACHAYMDQYIKDHGLPTKTGLFEILDCLDQLGIEKAVATSTKTPRALAKLEIANIRHRFPTIVGGDQVARSKPSPDIFLKAAADAGFLPGDCLVIEDSAAGAMGGYQAGMAVAVVEDIVPLSDETKGIASVICTDLSHVAAIIKGL